MAWILARANSFLDLVLEPIDQMLSRLGAFIPHALSALLILLIGLILARGLRTAAEALGSRLKIDERASLVGLNEILQRLGLGKSPTLLLGAAVYWFLLVAFLISAANALQLGVLTELVERFLGFLPSLVVALVTAFAGMSFAQFLSETVAKSAQTNNLRGGAALARMTLVAIWVLTGLLALEQLGLQNSILLNAVQIVLASAGLGFALAFGLGGKDVAAEYIREFLGRKKD